MSKGLLKTSLSEVAYGQLAQAILTGELGPGTRMREVELADRFGISRTPIRDAMVRLEAEGLITHQPRQGAVVRSLSHREIMELYEMRQVLEGTAARNAAVHASEPERNELERLNELMRDSAGDPEKVAGINRRFHAVLYECSHNRFLLLALESMANSMALLGPTTLASTDRTMTAAREHADILEAVALAQANQAEQAARAHIQSAQQARLELLRNF